MVQTITVLIFIVPLLIIAGVIAFVTYKFRYKTAKSNQALIITGPNLGKGQGVFTDEEGRSLKIIRGGGHLLKMNQTATPINLTSFKLNLTTPPTPTKGGVHMIADAVAMVSVADSLKDIAIYAEQFLGKKPQEIEEEISEVLGANLRAILSTLTVEQIIEDRKRFNETVQEVAQKQLGAMGFKITAMGLTHLRDADEKEGYLVNLGRPLIAKSKKEAEIAEAESQKETRIFIAKTEQESEEEELKRQTEIAEARKLKELRDQANAEETNKARAKAEQAYELEKTRLEKQVQEENLKLLAQKREEELRIAQLEKDKQVDIELRNAEVRKAQADAEFYEVTKQAEAEARKAEIDGQAKAKIQEEQGLAEAKVKREQGLAEAQVILEKGKAEAEAKKLLAQAIAEYGEVVILEKVIEMLPTFAEKVAQPLSNIDSIKIIDTGNGEGVNSYSKSITNTMTQIIEPLKELTGLDVTKLISDLATRGNTHTVVVPEVSKGVSLYSKVSEGVRGSESLILLEEDAKEISSEKEEKGLE